MHLIASLFHRNVARVDHCVLDRQSRLVVNLEFHWTFKRSHQKVIKQSAFTFVNNRPNHSTRNWLGNVFKQGGAGVFPWLWESLCMKILNVSMVFSFCVFPQIAVMDVSWTDKPLPPTNSTEHLCALNTRNESIPVPSEGISIVVTDKGSFTGKWQTVIGMGCL